MVTDRHLEGPIMETLTVEQMGMIIGDIEVLRGAMLVDMMIGGVTGE